MKTITITLLHQYYSTQTPSPSPSLYRLFTFLVLTNLVKANMFIYAGCSQGNKFQPNTPYEATLNSLLSSMASSSSQALYNSFALGNYSSANPDGSVFGLYQCRGDLKTRECSICIAKAIEQVTLVCPFTLGATMQLDGCFLRYEHSDFIGKLDTSLMFKRCGYDGVNDAADFVKRRDDVLADIQAGAAMGFRISSSGLVHGLAQCLGDLSASDCSACLSDAVAKMISLCGSAAAADVFLAQCYARYWVSSYYKSAPDSTNDDEVGKTVAIVVGVLAGVAIFVVLLSICRKALVG
ncbi:PREDICTED: cysteine-rich repeat secretory protein 15 [Ipomoea nil]|uniref:cysteine-rich repeat secretory protein 15 n=1 Tax=Ipomoea nil TaxID=35883 RepID=UPI0009014394|nr:PREDICTED: cysteine-rich repeat secretory protein 15 [Ipomoea nil]XP_019160970.1 PREDICTED: cysteine-rich repeat secretory protein 15 [Ipomoea nil]XP_019160971.1 PREDICTED: cysteine-rich repeat secretory protein 15 [Ipomoea nil]